MQIRRLLLAIPTLCGIAVGCVTFNETSSQQIYSFEDQFLKYLDATADIPISNTKKHLKAYKTFYVEGETYKQLYLDTIFAKRKSHETYDQLLEDSFTEKLPSLAKHFDIMKPLFANFVPEVKRQLKIFSKKLPDFDYSDLPIFGMVTLGRSLGGKRTHKGKTVLIFGIDEMARKSVDFQVLFSHEAFHVYHDQVNTNLRPSLKKVKRLLIMMSYIEGLATYASGQLNPQKYSQRYLDKDLEKACNSNLYRKFGREFLEDSRKLQYENFEANFSIASKWFYTKRDKEYPFPPMTGYCIGERALDMLGKKYSLAEMTRWSSEVAIEKLTSEISKW